MLFATSLLLCAGLAPATFEDPALELGFGQAVAGEYEWDVQLPRALGNSYFDPANFELEVTGPDGTRAKLAILSVKRARPAFDEQGILSGLFRSVGLRTTNPPSDDHTYRVRVTEELLAFYEAEGLPTVSAPVTKVGDGKKWVRLGEGMPKFNILARATDADNEDLAVDFAARWMDIDLSGPDSPGGSSWEVFNLSLKTDGVYKPELTEAQGADVGLNSVISELSLRYDVYSNAKDLDRQTTAYGVDAHVKHEATQDFDANTLNLGVGLHLSPGFLLPTDAYRYNFLDATRRADLAPPRFYVGLDLVSNADSTSREARTGDSDNSFPRLDFAAAWGFPVFHGDSYFESTYQGFLDLDADTDEYQSMVVLKLHVDVQGQLGAFLFGGEEKPSGERPPFVIQYRSGSLPPDYGTEHSMSAGLSFSF